MTQSFIFENVRIGKGCTLNTCIIGKGVVIEEGVTIGRGALLGDGVRIGKGQVVQPFARVGRTPFVKNEEDSDEEEDSVENQEGEWVVAIVCHVFLTRCVFVQPTRKN